MKWWRGCRWKPSLTAELKAEEAFKWDNDNPEDPWWFIPIRTDQARRIPRNIKAMHRAFDGWVVTEHPDKYRHDTVVRFRRKIELDHSSTTRLPKT